MPFLDSRSNLYFKPEQNSHSQTCVQNITSCVEKYWSTPTIALKVHDHTSLKNCFEKREISVIGDSRARQQAQAMKARYYNNLTFQANKEQKIPNLPPNLNYQWSKFLNTTEAILKEIPPPRDHRA